MSGRSGSISGKESFMANVAERLGRSRPLAEQPARDVRGVPEFYSSVRLSADDNIELFCAQWTALSGKALVVPRERAAEEVAAYMMQTAAEHNVTKAAIWRHEALDSLRLADSLEQSGITAVRWQQNEQNEPGVPAEAKRGPSQLLAEAEQCGMGIVCPDYAIANTGTLVLRAFGGRGRSVSLLPPVLFAVLDAKRIVTRMGESLTHLRNVAAAEDDGALPSSINLITGPSRSADIENDLTIGVHGPGLVYAVIIE